MKAVGGCDSIKGDAIPLRKMARDGEIVKGIIGQGLAQQYVHGLQGPVDTQGQPPYRDGHEPQKGRGKGAEADR